MKIVRVHAVYEGWPISLVVETDTLDLLELSLKELKEVEGTFDEHAWKQLMGDYKAFFSHYC
jgi:hypothetical protein